MKGLNWFDKFLFFLNSLFAVALLFSYLLPYIPPQTFAILSVFSLAVPLFIIINFLFLIYWMLRFKKQVFLPLVVLLIGFNHLTSIYEFSSTEELEREEGTLKLFSYNVKQFNQYGWDKQRDIPQKIAAFVSKEDPDIMGFQEYYSGELRIAENYEHKFLKAKEKNAEFGLAILSKYPIINTGSLDFPTKSNNNAIYADIVALGDTIRVFNVHFQSFSLKPDLGKMEQEHSKRVFLGMGRTFVRQQEQMQLVLEEVKRSPYRNVILGDFNNTAYSYIYREIRSAGFNDAYKEEGNGFGRSFDFDYFPLRIDYIMPDESFEILSFETEEVHYSDHFPIMALIKPLKQA